MGGGESKQSLEIERNRRLREFEEELVDSSSATHSPTPLTHQYFDQFLGPGSSNRRDSSVDGDATTYFGPGGEASSEGDEQVSDKEVEDAIAELEETFRTLSPAVAIAGRKDELGVRELERSQSCGPLTPPQMGGQNGGGSRDRVGTPMGPGGGGGVSGGIGIPRYNRRPHGHNNSLPHHRRGGTGLHVGGEDFKGGALSAPPGVSNVRDAIPQWTPPQIDGFDLDKFREANGVGGGAAVSDAQDEQGARRVDSEEESFRGGVGEGGVGGGKRGAKAKGVSAPPYTREEMELLRKLEREVC